jgi:cobalt/nickel transport system permease protein
MRTFWHDTWGCGRGPIARLAPHIRLVAGAIMLAACMVAPTESLRGSVLAAAAALGWLCACWPPLKLVRIVLGLAVAALAPYFLLVAVISHASSPALGQRPFAMALGLFVRGIAGIVVSVATVSTLCATDLRVALARLPVPAVVSAILLQIIHQSATLLQETRRVSAALAVRGASTRGRAAWRLLVSLPQVWLPRVVQRADRVAAAMELRGFCEPRLSFDDRRKVGWPDLVAVAAVVGVLAFAFALRCWSRP